MEQKDRIKGPAIIFLAIFLLYSAAIVFNYLFTATYKLEVPYNVVRIIVYAVMIIPTVVFLILLIKNKSQSKMWLHISAGVYAIGNIVLFVAANRLSYDATRIGPLRIEIFYIILIALYWVMLNSYFKTFKDKYNISQ